MRINNNLMAMNTHRQLGVNNNAGAKSTEKLSSGLRINRAGDDAAGLSISEKMRGQIRGLNQASSNAQDGISMIQTAEGALNETHAILQRMRELSVQASNDPNNNDDRQAIAQELKDLTSEIDRISETTAFNGKKLLNGDLGGAKINAAGEVKVGTALATTSAAITEINLTGAKSNETYTFTDGTGGKLTLTRASDSVAQTITLDPTIGADGTMDLNFAELGVSLKISGAAAGTNAQIVTDLTNAATDTITTLAGSSTAQFAIGANGDAAEKMNVAFDKFNASNLGIGGSELKTLITDIAVASVIDTSAKADALTKTVDASIKQVSEQRSKLGAAQNRLEHSIKNLDTSSENLQAAESRIRDVDMAKEMMESTKNNILAQAANAMLAQANQAPQAVLQLLR